MNCNDFPKKDTEIQIKNMDIRPIVFQCFCHEKQICIFCLDYNSITI